MSQFKKYVFGVVRKIPYGSVASYGQVALYAGVPRGARQVGWILNQSKGIDLPWWRVINNSGRITIKGNLYNDATLQRKLLLGEGVAVDEEFNLDIKKYRFQPDDKFFECLKFDDKYLDLISQKVPF